MELNNICFTIEEEDEEELVCNNNVKLESKTKNKTTQNMQQIIPEIVFIVPYRDRSHHKFLFCKHMSYILENTTNYEI